MVPACDVAIPGTTVISISTITQRLTDMLERSDKVKSPLVPCLTALPGDQASQAIRPVEG